MKTQGLNNHSITILENNKQQLKIMVYIFMLPA